jgi:hypothetical protein
MSTLTRDPFGVMEVPPDQRQPSALAQLAVNNVHRELVLWCHATGMGRSFVGMSYRCFPQDARLVRTPDVSYPEVRIVRIHRAPGNVAALIGNAELSDDGLLPGFRCPLPSLFATPQSVST